MSWKPELEELAHRRELMQGMGGTEGIDRQHGRGKLTVRERLPLLADPGTFAGVRSPARQRHLRRRRRAGVVHAAGQGRRDVPHRRAQGRRHRRRLHGARRIGERARRRPRRGAQRRRSERSSGGCRTSGCSTPPVAACAASRRSAAPTCPDANSFTHIDVSLLNTVPVVSAVMGAAAGIGALHTNLAHWNVMVDNTQVFPGGPPVVKAALGDRHHQGGARRPADPHPRERCRRQPRRTPRRRRSG